MACPGTLKGGSRKKHRSVKRRRSTRRKTNRRRSNKGGFVGGILEQAIVPFGLFALQKKMQNRKKTSKRKRKN